eukprot:m.39416 g.39416  ORF g.39416 m.39416 type:complete len:851 (-) comp13671_c0_seq1:80-2632(-)
MSAARRSSVDDSSASGPGEKKKAKGTRKITQKKQRKAARGNPRRDVTESDGQGDRDSPPTTIRRRTGTMPALTLTHPNSQSAADLRHRITAAREARGSAGANVMLRSSPPDPQNAAAASPPDGGSFRSAEGSFYSLSQARRNSAGPHPAVVVPVVPAPPVAQHQLQAHRDPIGAAITTDTALLKRKRRPWRWRQAARKKAEASELHSRLLAVIADRDLLLEHAAQGALHGGLPAATDATPRIAVEVDRTGTTATADHPNVTPAAPTSTSVISSTEATLRRRVALLEARVHHLQKRVKETSPPRSGPPIPTGTRKQRRKQQRQNREEEALQLQERGELVPVRRRSSGKPPAPPGGSDPNRREAELESTIATLEQALQAQEIESFKFAREVEQYRARLNELSPADLQLRAEVADKAMELKNLQTHADSTAHALRELQSSHEFVLTERVAEAEELHELRREMDGLVLERDTLVAQVIQDAESVIVRQLDHASPLLDTDKRRVPLVIKKEHEGISQTIIKFHAVERSRRASLQKRMRREEKLRRSLEKIIAEHEGAMQKERDTLSEMHVEAIAERERQFALLVQKKAAVEAAWKEKLAEQERMISERLAMTMQKMDTGAPVAVDNEVAAYHISSTGTTHAPGTPLSNPELAVEHNLDYITVAAETEEPTRVNNLTDDASKSAGHEGQAQVVTRLAARSTRRRSHQDSTKNQSHRRNPASHLSEPARLTKRRGSTGSSRGGTLAKSTTSLEKMETLSRDELEATLSRGTSEGRVYSCAVTIQKSSSQDELGDLFLTFDQGDEIEILFVNDPPHGLWLARDQMQRVGFLKSMDFSLPPKTIMSNFTQANSNLSSQA